MNITSALRMLIPGSKGSPEDVAMMREVDTILDLYHATTLTEMAQAAELMPRGGKKPRKSELVDLMREKFFTQERVQASLNRLNPRERAVLNRLQLRGNQVSTRNFERELLRAGMATSAPTTTSKNYYYGAPYAEGYNGSPSNPKSTVFEDVIARLTYHGLVFSRTAAANYTGTAFKLQFHPYTQIFIPLAVARHLPEPEPIPASQPDWQPGRVQHGDPNLLLRDMYLYWDFLRRNEVALLQNGGVGKRSLKAINATLLEPDPLLEQAQREDETNRLVLLRRLIEGLKLAQADPGRLRPTGDSTGVPPFWSRPQAEQLRTCLELWPKLTSLTELGSEANSYSPRYTEARQVILGVLKTLPPNRWLEREEFLELIRSQNPDFLFYERTKIENYRGSWYYSSSGSNYYGDPKGIIKKFDELELKFIDRCLAPGFLYQLGLIEVGYNQADPLIGEPEQWFAFRLTPTGQTILSQPVKSKTAAAPPDDEGRVVVQPNFQIMALGPVPLATLAQLDLFADREQADRGAFQYRLSRDSVYRAQQLGLDAGEVMRLLAQITSMELPQNVRRSLEEWGSHHERIVFRTGVNLLQAASPALLERLTSPEAPTAALLARPLTPDVALTPNGQQKELVAALVAQGLLPAVSGAKPEAADKSVIIRADGLIQPIHAVPSLHLRGRLARLAEETHEGQWRLTPASVRRATGSRVKVISLLEELSKLHRGPLPDELAVQLKAWGNYYGNASVSTLTLIEFRDHTALEELRDRPEVGPYLTPFPAGNRALAIIPTDKVAELQEILARFGVKVQLVGE